jgi:hypothetical protein
VEVRFVATIDFLDPAPGASHAQLAELAARLLAQGVLSQRAVGEHNQVLLERFVSPQLAYAMGLLERLASPGESEYAASHHAVIAAARHRLGDPVWGVPAFRDAAFPFQDVVLIDPDTRLPLPDCAELAGTAGAGVASVEEEILYHAVRDAVDGLRGRGQLAYTALRELLVRESLQSRATLRSRIREHRLLPIESTVYNLFDPVPPGLLVQSFALRCARCGSLVRPDESDDTLACTLEGCRTAHPVPEVGERIPAVAEPLLARPSVLCYWTDPGRDEIAIYDAARIAGLQDVRLYPHFDECDIAIGDTRVGIDVKAHRSPVLLGRKLSRGIGGLMHYDRRILAIPDQRIRRIPGYVDRLKEEIESVPEAVGLEILSVGELIANIGGLA